MNKQKLLAELGLDCPTITFGQHLQRNVNAMRYPYRYWAFCNVFCRNDSGHIVITQPGAEGAAQTVDLNDLLRNHGKHSVWGFTGEAPVRYASFRWRLDFEVNRGQIDVSFICETPMLSETLGQDIRPGFGARVSFFAFQEDGNAAEWSLTSQAVSCWCQVITHMPHTRFPEALL